MPPDYVERCRGRFDAGWDEVCRATFERQKELGLVPADNDLPPSNPGVSAWTDLDADARRLYARLMETFAGFVDHTDDQIARLVGDNGASEEGQDHGSSNTERFRNGLPMTVEGMLPRLDEIGRAVHGDGWMAVTWHQPGTSWDDDRWELYDQRVDYSQARDLADGEPELLVERWWDEARATGVLPLDDRGLERYFAAGRRPAAQDRTVYRHWPGTSPVPAQALPQALLGRHRITAHLTLGAPEDQGYLVGCGGELVGWALYVRDRRVTYVDNHLRLSLATRINPRPPANRPGGGGVVDLDAAGRGTGRRKPGRRRPRGDSNRGTDPPGLLQPGAEGLQVGRRWAPSVAPTHFSDPFPITGALRLVEVHVLAPEGA